MFGNFAKIASLCMGFHPGTLHGYFFHSDFWPNLNFLLEHQKTCLNQKFVSGVAEGVRWVRTHFPR